MAFALNSSNYHVDVSDEANGWGKRKKNNSKLVFLLLIKGAYI